MTDYIGNALEQSNPCGIEGRPETHCRYAKECASVRDKENTVCISKVAHMIAGYLRESTPETERREYRNYLLSLAGGEFVDPTKDSWVLEQITADKVDGLAEKIVAKAQQMLTNAQTTGSLRNPINSECSMEDIVKDLV